MVRHFASYEDLPFGMSDDTDGSGGTAHSGTSGGTGVTPPKTFLDGIMASILTPGASPGLVSAVNGALILLIILAVYGYFGAKVLDGHMMILAILAVGLLGAFNWCVTCLPSKALLPASTLLFHAGLLF
jgi:hypothetical protein